MYYNKQWADFKDKSQPVSANFSLRPMQQILHGLQLSVALRNLPTPGGLFEDAVLARSQTTYLRLGII